MIKIFLLYFVQRVFLPETLFVLSPAQEKPLQLTHEAGAEASLLDYALQEGRKDREAGLTKRPTR